MEGLNSFIITLAVLLVPGLLWARFDARYTRQSKPSDFNFILNALIFGFISYMVAGLLYPLLNYIFPSINFDVMSLTSGNTDGPLLPAELLDDVSIATVIALLLAIATLYIETYKLIWRALQRIRATRRYGDEDVWDFTLTSGDATASYVNVRDHSNGLIFSGYVRTFSEAGPLREIQLSDVIVYKETDGSQLYAMPHIYIARSPEGMTVEFPAKQENLKDGSSPSQ